MLRAKAASAWGKLGVAHSITHITSASLVSEVREKIDTLEQIPTVASQKSFGRRPWCSGGESENKTRSSCRTVMIT